jgi:ABC-2 type transport system permease protein
MQRLVPSILIKTLTDQQRGLVWWFLGIVALGLVTVLLYPSIGAAPEMERLFEDLPPAAQVFIGEIADITSPEGYLNSQLFALMVPLLFMVYCIGQGSGAIAGEEAAGTMDLLLANPVPRSQIVLQKFGAMLAGGMVLAFANLVGLVVGAILIDMEISLGRLSEATLAALLVGYLFGGLALLLSAWTGKRGVSIGVSSGIGVVTYLLNGFALIISWLEPYRYLSPFHYYAGNDPLVNGIDGIDSLVLIAITGVLLAGAVYTFERRDVQV